MNQTPKTYILKKDLPDTNTESEQRYNMTYDQPAQIDCRMEVCVFNKGSGQCSNISPAITLNLGGKFACWSMKHYASDSVKEK